MSKTHTEIKQEIVEQIAASAHLGQNVRNVKMDVEHFSESMLDLVQLERMKARTSQTTQLHFQAGQRHELEAVLRYLTNLQVAQPKDRAILLGSIITELSQEKHREQCER